MRRRQRSRRVNPLRLCCATTCASTEKVRCKSPSWKVIWSLLHGSRRPSDRLQHPTLGTSGSHDQTIIARLEHMVATRLNATSRKLKKVAWQHYRHGNTVWARGVSSIYCAQCESPQSRPSAQYTIRTQGEHLRWQKLYHDLAQAFVIAVLQKKSKSEKKWLGLAKTMQIWINSSMVNHLLQNPDIGNDHCQHFERNGCVFVIMSAQGRKGAETLYSPCAVAYQIGKDTCVDNY